MYLGPAARWPLATDEEALKYNFSSGVGLLYNDGYVWVWFSFISLPALLICKPHLSLASVA